MRNDFLTIPGTNYEINSELVCRNKKTGRLLTAYKDKNKTWTFNLFVDGKTKSRSAKSWRRVAKAATMPDTFIPIPSLNGRYEINYVGTVRNVKTKVILKPYSRCRSILFNIDKKKFIRAIADLLWEAHGKIIKRRFRPCPCSAESKSGKNFFDNLTQCAHFLAPKVFYAVGTVKDYLYRRDTFIGEWKITYLESDPTEIKSVSKENERVARRMKKLDEELGL